MKFGLVFAPKHQRIQRNDKSTKCPPVFLSWPRSMSELRTLMEFFLAVHRDMGVGLRVVDSFAGPSPPGTHLVCWIISLLCFSVALSLLLSLSLPTPYD
ncbi:hypothetical protein BO82DRAFT_21901 [Aspergillus uvarum CBS 121591]|uniref:Uncharacterized protein n=1 Tax=Aspergillus uvarum CBS 121591 TaxID=1448315 RepID=A0A319BS48_9EURO|nr:hypothetical protein BO82DRAFT_21901 [Aspergillus uvarum CBS 121591]PYH75505.1 hypothetical protein BO82DRAFT_21901 [Aspergillus uvarum CBS 121591]